jgi:hypothetical protein
MGLLDRGLESLLIGHGTTICRPLDHPELVGSSNMVV